MNSPLARRLLIIVVLLLALAACGENEVPADTPVPTLERELPTATLQPTAGIEISEVTFAHGLTEEMRAIDPGNDFAPDETVYLSVTIKGRPKSGVVTARFHWHDLTIAEASADLADVNSGVLLSIGESTYVGYNLSLDDPFPISGFYRADLFYDDIPLDSYEFHVVPPSDAIPSIVKKVTLARGVDENNNATEPTTSFKADDTVHLVASGDLGLSTWIQADWLVDDRLDEDCTRSLTLYENAPDNSFWFSCRPADGWPSGTHRVVLTMNDQEVGTYPFTVEE